MNSCGVLAMRTLAAGMQGGMTSPVRPWFRLRLKDQQIEGTSGVNIWLEEVATRMQRVLNESNFYNAVHGLYAELGTFGTGLLVETADENGLHFHLVHAGEYVLDANGKNEVDTFFRRLHLSARQIVDRFGEDVCPSAVLSAAKTPGAQGSVTRFNVIHGVFPRKDYDASAKFCPRAMPFASVYWLSGGAETGRAAILSEGGYHSFPAFAPRWDVQGTDIYGRSPAMDVAPDVKMLQAMTTSLRRMQHKIAEPPLLASSSLRSYGVSQNPGALNYVNMENMSPSGAPVVPMGQPEPAALNYTMQGIADVEKVVRDGLYADLFRLIIDDDRRQITATEIQARQQEKMMLIGPVVERLHKELLSPLITRTYQLMAEYGALPPLPADAPAGELDVTFESVLAQAQKLTATSAIEQGLSFVFQTAQARPETLDLLNMDETIRNYLERVGMPEGCINDADAVAQNREARAQAQARAEEQAQAQAAMQQAVDMSQAAKNLGQTPAGADGQTLMGTLLGGIGGA